MNFSLICLNTWGNNEPCQKRFELITKEIKKYNPSLVCLQEVFEPVLTEQLIKQIGFEYHFANLASGLLTLSRLPIEKTQILKYQHQSTLENNDRRLILVKIKYKKRSFWVGNTHLSWKPDDETARLMQTRELVACITQLGQPAMVMGDFNATPDSDAMNVLVKSGFANVYDVLHPNQTTYTWDNQRNPYLKTHATILPDRRIDHLYISQSFQAMWRPQTCRLIFTTPDAAGHLPSDHFGWLATFSWGQVGV